MVLEKGFLEDYKRERQLSTEDALAEIVQSGKALARPPVSGFQVAAVGLGPSGRLFLGVNLEFPGLPLSNSVHAEQFLVANALQQGEESLVMIAVTHAPCGHCRQFISELRGAEQVRILIADGRKEGFQKLPELLPQRFGPSDLLADGFPLMMEPQRNELALPEEAVQKLPEGGRDEALFAAALEAASSSYCPYSLSPSGVALRTKDGSVLKGSYLESAAYNPSLPPLQSALVALVSRGYAYSDVLEVMVVERKDAKVQFGATVMISIGKIAPLAS